MNTTNNAQWAIVELMGHLTLAGKISQESTFPNMIRLDVPWDNDKFKTEIYGMSAIYRIRFVSEDIARAYAFKAENQVFDYDTPIITLEQHRAAINKFNDAIDNLKMENSSLRNRIHQLASALPEGNPEEEPDENDNTF